MNLAKNYKQSFVISVLNMSLTQVLNYDALVHKYTGVFHVSSIRAISSRFISTRKNRQA